MSREIKFRAWDKTIYQMLKYEDMSAMSMGNLHGNIRPKLSSFLENPDCEVMQYTGLKDKNGVDIYEGDILESPNSTQQVYFDKGCFGLKSLHHNESFNPHPLFKMNMDFWTVIGNIYQNPELIK